MDTHQINDYPVSAGVGLVYAQWDIYSSLVIFSFLALRICFIMRSEEHGGRGQSF